MITFSLQSGSNGNCIYVEAGGVRLLFDAGISGKCAEARMSAHGRNIRDVDALLISHDHVDHLRCAGVFQRKFKVPIHMTRTTHAAAPCDLGKLSNVHYFTAGDRLRFNGVTVHTIPTPHDAADGVGFVVEHNGTRLGILTDLGHPFAALRDWLETLDAVYLESNYDPQMLATGPYPRYLQERIRGPHGHLSNPEAAELIRSAGRRLQWAALAHLSQENNHPEIALETHRRHVGRTFPFHLAGRYDVSELLEI
ncbi:MAG TPA: MBL fold metallo-hydrolase [Phycisphaerae bacterium]|jgi:phosphoribosyl 1,2-cyclic phosphodiesterase|nr:MBL fold metallo-hydrolase [Phycisphaerae bacterium]HOB75000.1 MBL fold metallo-hydrolase [Phycisphaerae bacterium]HOJ55092.1 MBL fold metallo-hydrolase [Phycisphaerae bacterium]HOL28420.1 MBL fold metallo-hydrolase [Phycisphaerae bacterium]HPP21715.1 MBL fold metallo-hydrolase [Phycisphaerae bacterium]